MRYFEFDVLILPDLDGDDLEDFYQLDNEPIVDKMKIHLDSIGAYKASKLIREGYEKPEEVVVIYTSGFEIMLLCSMKKFEEVLFNYNI